MNEDGFDWGGSYSCEWRLMEVDPRTWDDSSEVNGVMSLSVSRDSDGELIDEGSAIISMDPGEAPHEFWGRIEVLAGNGGVYRRQAIATLYFIPGKSTVRKGRKLVDYACMSVLYPASTRSLLAGSNFAKGAEGGSYVTRLLSDCTPAPVSSTEMFALQEDVVYAEGTKYLEAAWMLLKAANWCLRISEMGEISVQPMPEDPSLVLDVANARLLNPEIEVDNGLEDAINRYIAATDDRVAIAVDDSDSPSSYTVRGFYVDEYDSSPQLLDGESLDEYCQRRLDELSGTLGTRTYGRAFFPDVLPFDVVEGSIASVGLDCTMRVVSQSIDIGHGVHLTETAEVIDTWQST